MKFNKDTKEAIHYISAVILLIFGMTLSILGFYTPPIGEIDGSVLAVLGQTIVFAASVYGISLHYNNELKSFKNQVINELKEDKDKRK